MDDHELAEFQSAQTCSGAAQQRPEADTDLAALDPRSLGLLRWADNSGRIPMTDFDFKLRGRRLVKVQRGLLGGRVVATHDPVRTRIVQFLGVGNGVVVREDYYGFPPDSSNLYCLDSNFNVLWRAELPMAEDSYANPFFVTPQGITCASWNGFTCVLDPATGRIRSSIFTK